MRVLITGGAGFVGSRLALHFRSDSPECQVVVFDNLRRRGSELNLPVLKAAGVEFVHGDIRMKDDLAEIPGEFDLFIEASAEPSVLAGLSGSPTYVLETNLVGTLNCLELARRKAAHLLFLSTSRVYSIRPLGTLTLVETETRFELAPTQNWPGATSRGISETFPTHLPRSFYGASKLASELVIQEYADTYGLSALVNRCGVIAGPGQMGKVDQGVFTLWVARHYFGADGGARPLRYTGFGGRGLQVRDLLHPADLYRLLKLQWAELRAGKHRGEVFNVGGGREVSTSLREWTEHCEAVTGRSLGIEGEAGTSSVDIPLYLSDTSKVSAAFAAWQPQLGVRNIADSIVQWLRENERDLKPIFC